MPKKSTNINDDSNIVTAFHRDIIIHPEYYYNAAKVIDNSEYSISRALITFKTIIEITIVSLTIGRISLIHLESKGMEFSSNNLLKTTAATAATIGLFKAAVFYGCSEGISTNDIQKYIYDMHDDFVFTAEYVFDYATDIF